VNLEKMAEASAVPVIIVVGLLTRGRFGYEGQDGQAS
jgi:hypothetical protein